MAIETPARQVTATHRIVHFDIPAADVDTLCGFYHDVFGWTFRGSEGMESYKMAQIGQGEASMAGAIYPKDSADQRPMNYVQVESVDDYAEKITQHGGTVLHKFTVTGHGHGALALDPEQNPVGLWSADPTARQAD